MFCQNVSPRYEEEPERISITWFLKYQFTWTRCSANTGTNKPARRTSLSSQADHHWGRGGRGVGNVDLTHRSVFSYMWCLQIVYGLTAR